MTELEKLKAGLEYCYDDPEVATLKTNAIPDNSLALGVPAKVVKEI